MEQEISFLGFTDPKIVNLIISFLSIEDLLNLTSTCKDLNAMISSSQHNRIKLTIGEHWSKEFEFTDVAHSIRKYDTLFVKTLLRRQSEVIKAIGHFSSTLTTIITTFDFNMPEGANLPRVKTLEMRNRDGIYYQHGLMSTVNNLETLKLSGGIKHQLPIENWVAVCLSVNPKLRTLEFEGEIAYVIFSRLNHTYFDFRLQRFAISIPDNSRNMHNFNHNLKHFVISQDSIVDLKLMKIAFIYLVEILNELDNVARLTYSDGMSGEIYSMYGYDRLQLRESVNELNLVCDPKFKFALCVMLARMPNVERLYYAMCNRAIINEVYKFPSVAELSFAVGDKQNSQEFVEQLNRCHFTTGQSKMMQQRSRPLSLRQI